MDREPDPIPNPMTVTLTFTGTFEGFGGHPFEGRLIYDPLADPIAVPSADDPSRLEQTRLYPASLEFALKGNRRPDYGAEVVLVSVANDVNSYFDSTHLRMRDLTGTSSDSVSFSTGIQDDTPFNPYVIHDPFRSVRISVSFGDREERAGRAVDALETDTLPLAFGSGGGSVSLFEPVPYVSHLPRDAYGFVDTSDFPLRAPIDHWEFAIEGTGTPQRNATETEVSRIALMLAASEAGLETDTLNLWVDRAEAGLSGESIRAVLAPSVPEAETDGDYVEALFQGLLGRDPDFYGDWYWTGLLETGEMTRAAVWEAFALSPEHRARAPEAAELAEIEPGYWDLA
ncbi:MAG: DUF4214 domain-containing protein [Pseudomonadota bacterium]